MDKYELIILYEKMYFHEMDLKEKLHNRIQIVFALSVIIATVITYILKNISYTRPCLYYIITSMVFIACCFLVWALFLLKNAFWGNEFLMLSTPNQITEHLENLKKHNATLDIYNNTYPDAQQVLLNIEDEMREMMFHKFQECTTHNMDVNVSRSAFIHKSVLLMFRSLIPLAIALVVFLYFDLDSSAPRNISINQAKVIIVNNPYVL